MANRSSADRRFLGHLFNGVYEQLLPHHLSELDFELLAGGPDERGRVFRPVVWERTIFGHVEARRVTTFDYLLARGDDVFLVEATGWQTAQGLTPVFGADTLRLLEGRLGTEVVRRLAHLDLCRHECLVNRRPSDRQPKARMLLWWDVDPGAGGRPGVAGRAVHRGRTAGPQGDRGRLDPSAVRGLLRPDWRRRGAAAARIAVARYAELSTTRWDGVARADLALLDEAAAAGAA